MFHFGIVADAGGVVAGGGVRVVAGPVLAAAVIVVVVVYAAGWRARVLRRVHLLGLIHPAACGSEDSVDPEDAGGVVDGRRKSSQLLTLLARDAGRGSHSIHRDERFLVFFVGWASLRL